MRVMDSDFYEDDEPADKIHRVYEAAVDGGRAERPVPGGGVMMLNNFTVGVGRPPVEPGATLRVQISPISAGV